MASADYLSEDSKPNTTRNEDWRNAVVTFFAFIGMECATVPSGSVENPEKTIPLATLLGTVLVTVVYILSTISVMGIIPANELQVASW